MGCYKGLTSKRTGNQSAASIEAEPAEPQQAAAKQGKGQVVGRCMQSVSGLLAARKGCRVEGACVGGLGAGQLIGCSGGVGERTLWGKGIAV